MFLQYSILECRSLLNFDTPQYIVKKLNAGCSLLCLQTHMQVMSQSSDSALRTALGSIDSETKKTLESFKVKGVVYQEFQIEDPGSKGRMLPRVGKDLPSQPGYTTWSGLMRCSPKSPYAARLME